MAVTLLPFQKIVDIPDVAQRHRCAMRGLAISSFVLSSVSLCLFVVALISTARLYTTGFTVLFAMFSCVSMVVLFTLVCVSSAAVLHNTDKWVSTDVCCNLIRSRPACCTRSCAGNKHCCARLSCAHTAAAGLTSVLCALMIGLLVAGCRVPVTSYGYNYNDYIRDDGRSYYYDTTTTNYPTRYPFQEAKKDEHR